MKQLIFVLVIVLFVAACGSSKKMTSETASETTEMTADTTAIVIPLEVTIKIPETNSEETETEQESILEEEIETETEIEMEAVIPSEAFNHTLWDELLKAYVTKEGNVNYNGFESQKLTLRKYITSLGQKMPTDSWTQEDKLAYWMNAYNAMTVDLILRHMPLESIKDIKDPWDQRYWKLGEKYYNLDEIEHQILRKMDEPRIHFGINCASFSCPPLLNVAFTAGEVDAQLDFLANRFINDRSRNTIASDRVEISKIFDWFGKDFKQNGSLIDYLNQYSEVTISSNARVRYKEYDWALND
ncbi:DUF547 domain-containing protein [Jejudonia soesokkakensis]|uniref:DUF547 domain-containing protein n=1 Tax=Jejudonia soesokkakensis TaxID=1323432 RepID=A0ABW2MSZ5_9FLAO